MEADWDSLYRSADAGRPFEDADLAFPAGTCRLPGSAPFDDRFQVVALSRGFSWAL
jgi:hypothetical protein